MKNTHQLSIKLVIMVIYYGGGTKKRGGMEWG